MPSALAFGATKRKSHGDPLNIVVKQGGLSMALYAFDGTWNEDSAKSLAMQLNR